MRFRSIMLCLLSFCLCGFAAPAMASSHHGKHNKPKQVAKRHAAQRVARTGRHSRLARKSQARHVAAVAPVPPGAGLSATPTATVAAGAVAPAAATALAAVPAANPGHAETAAQITEVAQMAPMRGIIMPRIPRGDLDLRSNVALVMDQASGEMMFSKNADEVHPIASISKLMTAQVLLDAQLPMGETIQVLEEDKDTERNSRSRLRVGTELSRRDLLQLALMSSENRAAHALARTYPGGMNAFVEAMNRKAQALGMTNTHFIEPTGLSSANVSTASDLARLVRNGERYPLIRQFTTSTSYDVNVLGRTVRFANTNRLVGSESWDILLSKTGFINEAGRCLVMQAKIAGRVLTIVLLDSWGSLTRTADANRIRKWLMAAGLEPRHST
jgi:D-alanyl-D-alanine endopeptidase (penicillin-binding protein 7)